MRIRFQLISLGAAIVLATGICGWAAFWSSYKFWKFSLRPDLTLTHTKQEYANAADRISSTISDLNESLTLFATQNDTGESNRFLQTSQSFESWIDSQQNNSKVIVPGIPYTRDTAPLFNQIKQSFEAYRTTAWRVLDPPENSTARSAFSESTLILQTYSSRLLEAASKFRSYAERPDRFTQQRSLELRRALMTVLALFVLLVVCIWLVIRFYRKEIVPLRHQLVQHTATIEKQQKLAHFGELAAGLAHEIRNPLTAINARLFTLQRTLLPNSPGYADTLVIRNEITRLDRVVSDFLSLARPATPEFTLLTSEPILREIVELLSPSLLSKNIKLTIESTTPASFQGDPIQLKQVLINLVKNASESINCDGSITLRSRTTTQTNNKHTTEAVVIEVEDTGSGIPRQVRDRLFEPFFSTKETGTGLGLSISWQIINKHGGTLDFHNKHTTGTIFTITLPRQKEV